jgi:hypothetical protein
MSDNVDTRRSTEARLRLIEDHLAIYQLVAAYGPGIDSLDFEQSKELWTEDGVYDLEGIGVYEGASGLRAMLDRPFSQKVLKGGSAHVLSLPYVIVEGDRAAATNYGRIYVPEDGCYAPVRVVATRWSLIRTENGWRIERRVNRLTNGNDPARALLAAFSRGPSEPVETSNG